MSAKKYGYFLGWYFFYVYNFLKRPYTEGAGVIVEDSGKLLMIRHTYGHRNLWGFPGGHKEDGEDFKSAAQRELLEEVGLDIPIKKLGEIKIYEDFRHSTGGVFYGKYDGSEIKLQTSEIREYKWWPKDNLPTNISPATKGSIKLFL